MSHRAFFLHFSLDLHTCLRCLKSKYVIKHILAFFQSRSRIYSMNTALFDINNIPTRVHVSSVNKQSLFSLQFMRTNLPDVFSAGDVTSFPLTIRGDEMVNIGHWQMSQAQGMILENSQSYFYFSQMTCLYLNKHLVNVFFFHLRKSCSLKYAEETNII